MDFFSGGAGPKYQNPRSGFDAFANEMDKASKRYQGYVDTGDQSRNMWMDQNKRLIDNPNAVQDQVSAGYYESPYQKMIQDRVTKRLNFNSANTGMLGSGAANRSLMDELTSMTGQFQNDYINRGMDSYKLGISGLGDLSHMGLDALGSQDNLIEQGAAGRLKGFMGEMEANQRNAEAEAAAKNRGFGNLIGFAGGVAGGIMGGPGGAKIGSSIGSMVGGGGSSYNSIGNTLGSMFSRKPQMPNGYFQPQPGMKSQIPVPFSGEQYNTGSWSY